MRIQVFILLLILAVNSAFGQDKNYNEILNAIKKNDLKTAISICKDKISKDSNDSKAHAYLSYAYLISSETKKISIDVDALRQRGIQKGQSYIFNKKESIKDFLYWKTEYNHDTLILSEKAMLKAVKLQSNNLEYLTSLGQIYFSQKKHSKLMDLINFIGSKFRSKSAADALNKIGMGYFNQKNHEKALDVYRIIISNYDRYASAYSDAGAIYLSIGKPDSAIHYLKVAYFLDPKDSLNLQSLYQLYLFKQEFQQAVYYKSFLYIADSNNFNHILDLGFLYFNFDKNLAIYMFNRFLQLTKNNDIYNDLGKIIKEIRDDLEKNDPSYYPNLLKAENFYRSGYINYALCILSKLVVQIKNYSPALFNLAFIYRDISIFDKSIEYLTRCEYITYELEKTRKVISMVYVEKAKTYFLANDYSNVIKYVKLCIEKYKVSTSELHYLLGLAYQKFNRNDLAKNEFNEAIRINDNKNIVEQVKMELKGFNFEIN